MGDFRHASILSCIFSHRKGLFELSYARWNGWLGQRVLLMGGCQMYGGCLFLHLTHLASQQQLALKVLNVALPYTRINTQHHCPIFIHDNNFPPFITLSSYYRYLTYLSVSKWWSKFTIRRSCIWESRPLVFAPQWRIITVLQYHIGPPHSRIRALKYVILPQVWILTPSTYSYSKYIFLPQIHNNI
jgi:hypothetical protein